MKILARYPGKLGDIAIWEDEADGTRFYLEDDIFQSHGSANGHSQLDYVKIMEAFFFEPTTFSSSAAEAEISPPCWRSAEKKLLSLTSTREASRSRRNISGCPNTFGVS